MRFYSSWESNSPRKIFQIPELLFGAFKTFILKILFFFFFNFLLRGGEAFADSFIVLITAFPDVVEKEINPDYEFVILACDGIWDVLENEDVVKFIRARIAQKMQPETVSCI